MIACEVMFVEQRAGGSQGSSVWLVQLVLHRLCGNEQTLFHPFSLVGCQGCCKLSFLPYSTSPSVGKVGCLLHRITSTSTSNPVSNEGAVAGPRAARSRQDCRAPDRLCTGICNENVCLG